MLMTVSWAIGMDIIWFFVAAHLDFGFIYMYWKFKFSAIRLFSNSVKLQSSVMLASCRPLHIAIDGTFPFSIVFLQVLHMYMSTFWIPFNKNLIGLSSGMHFLYKPDCLVSIFSMRFAVISVTECS